MVAFTCARAGGGEGGGGGSIVFFTADGGTVRETVQHATALEKFRVENKTGLDFCTKTYMH